MIATAETKTANWHKVKPEDSSRIACHDCGAPAEYCEHMHWDSGGGQGVSFFYYCSRHWREPQDPPDEPAAAVPLGRVSLRRHAAGGDRRGYGEPLLW